MKSRTIDLQHTDNRTSEAGHSGKCKVASRSVIRLSKIARYSDSVDPAAAFPALHDLDDVG